MITTITKIMNHRITPNSGKTVTVRGVINASELESAACTYNAQAENIKKSSVLADGTFNTLAEVIQVARRVADVNSATKDSNVFLKLGSEFKTELSKLLDTTIDGKKVLAETIKIDTGLGSGTVEIGVNLAEDDHYKVVEAATSIMAADGKAYDDQVKLDNAVDGLYTTASVASAKASFLDNRYNTLCDLAENTKNAKVKQVVRAGGSPTSLLNSIF